LKKASSVSDLAALADQAKPETRRTFLWAAESSADRQGHREPFGGQLFLSMTGVVRKGFFNTVDPDASLGKTARARTGTFNPGGCCEITPILLGSEGVIARSDAFTCGSGRRVPECRLKEWV
jgi:hypothetical protein